MELLLLGTAAAEGWPAPFCTCVNCQEARRRGGMNLRTRPGALIDEDLKIDFGPDTLVQMQRTGRNLAGVKTILFTHQHSDHVAPMELQWMAKPFTQTPPAPIDIWGNEQVVEMIRQATAPLSPQFAKAMRLHTIHAGEHFTTAQGDEVLAMSADHVEGALVLRIKRQGKVIFYGHDSGLYPQATLDALCDGTHLDIALLDCTFGGIKSGNRGHMGIDGIVKMTDHLRKAGVITDRTRVIATHFSHNGGLQHEELVEQCLPHRIEVAFDGMIVKV